MAHLFWVKNTSSERHLILVKILFNVLSYLVTWERFGLSLKTVHTECRTPVFWYAHVHAWSNNFIGYWINVLLVLSSWFFFFPIYDIITLEKYFADLWSSLWGIRDWFLFIYLFNCIPITLIFVYLNVLLLHV